MTDDALNAQPPANRTDSGIQRLERVIVLERLLLELPELLTSTLIGAANVEPTDSPESLEKKRKAVEWNAARQAALAKG